MERLCTPEAVEGAWLRRIDLVERDDPDGGGRRLALEKMESEGPCGVECGTVALACRAVLDGMENELGEALYAGSADAAALRARACREWSAACKRPAPRLDPARRDGPPFRAYTVEERGMREQRGGPLPPGVLSADALRVRLGLAPAGGAATLLDAHGGSMGVGGTMDRGEEAAGRGPAVPLGLAHSAAFAEQRTS